MLRRMRGMMKKAGAAAKAGRPANAEKTMQHMGPGSGKATGLPGRGMLSGPAPRGAKLGQGMPSDAKPMARTPGNEAKSVAQYKGQAKAAMAKGRGAGHGKALIGATKSAMGAARGRALGHKKGC